ncbi:MAG: hypothetical protein HN742_15870 [Lentisphaerae bacterium]|nr:hypothetical protein [Lentisphaerota bacterium]MBT4817415.1 hypothetical protein [Lentisphaerota bacterium]MBT5607713.1 hypothetical protein [Lentisphaerota bacterium]MBT7054876.1 hypothetical protein [Lentisphaerota bacterium]MBT7843354.1 hypothetical protein [Lentisphaerota bacterium]
MIADRRWHHAEVDLAGLLSAHGLSHRTVTGLAFMSTGYPGNEEGLAYHIDNTALVPAVNGQRGVRIAWTPEPADAFSGFSFSLDRNPEAMPDQEVDAADPYAEFADLPEGEHLFRLRGRHVGGTWSEAEDLRFFVRRSDDVAPPTAEPVGWKDTDHIYPTIRVHLADAGTGIDPGSIRLIVNGHTHDLRDPSLSYTPSSGQLVWDPAGTRPEPTVLSHRTEITCRLSVEDAAGNALPRPLEWSWTMDQARDRTPPSAPHPSYIPEHRLLRHTFEAPTETWGDWGMCMVSRSDAESATGSHSLSLLNAGAGESSYLALLDVRVPTDEYPWIRLEVRLSETGTGGMPVAAVQKLFFNGKRDTRQLVGGIGEADGTAPWQAVELDLRAGRVPKAGQPYGILVGSHPKRKGSAGAAMLVDNVTIYSRRSRDATFEWNAPADAGGIAGYAWAFDQAEGTVPEPKITGAGNTISFTDIEAGTWWFHIRAVDQAGNWGPAEHCRIELER